MDPPQTSIYLLDRVHDVARHAADIERPRAIATVGDGRLGRALSHALRSAGYDVVGPLGRGAPAPEVEVVLLCVPDREIPAAAAATAARAAFVGHTSGATGLDALDGREAFSLHPLQTVTDDGADFAGCGCAIAGTTPSAEAVARELAIALQMTPFVIRGAERAAYHAAASVASNFFVTLMDAAEAAAQVAGIPRDEARALLAPLVETTLRNWVAHGPERALTGPIARGDEATVAAQRAALPPDLVPLFDALAERTRALASRGTAVPA